MKHNIKKLAAMATAAALTIGFGARAQSVQEGSIWAPAGVKVDAKLDEWGNTLQANNKTTNLYYTIANDDRFLYLVIKSTDQANNNKITGGGITFSVNTDGKKKDKDAFQVIFPVVNRENMRAQFRRGGGGPGGQPNQMPDSATIANMRASLLSSVKEITLRGFKNIPDSVISIYNEYSIKAAVGYDKNGSFVYELALPLEQLGVKPGSTKELAYNVKVNGIQFRRNNNDGEGRGGDGGGNGGGGFGGGGGRGNGGGFGGGGGGRGFGGGGRGGFGGMNFQDMLNPTDFWGKYTLAKKQ